MLEKLFGVYAGIIKEKTKALQLLVARSSALSKVAARLSRERAP